MSKLVTTKTTTKRYVIQEIVMDMMSFDEVYRRIRGSRRHKLFKCFSCGRDFIDGEKISIVFIKSELNNVVCHECGVEIQAELGEEQK